MVKKVATNTYNHYRISLDEIYDNFSLLKRELAAEITGGKTVYVIKEYYSTDDLDKFLKLKKGETVEDMTLEVTTDYVEVMTAKSNS